MDNCMSLVPGGHVWPGPHRTGPEENACAERQRQGIALVHISTQLKRNLWDMGAFRDCLGGV